MNDAENSEDDLIKAVQLAVQTDDIAAAAERYERCLGMIPDVYGSAYGTQIYMSLGELYYLEGEYEEAAPGCYSEAVKCVGGLGLTAIHLRLGQIRCELGDMDRARDELMRAYMGAGENIFDIEDPKYFEVIAPIFKR